MEVPPAQRGCLGEPLGEIEPLGGVAVVPTRSRKPLTGCSDGGLHPSACIVESLSQLSTTLGVQGAEQSSSGGEQRPATEQFSLDSVDLGEARSLVEALNGEGHSLIELVE